MPLLKEHGIYDIVTTACHVRCRVVILKRFLVTINNFKWQRMGYSEDQINVMYML